MGLPRPNHRRLHRVPKSAYLPSREFLRHFDFLPLEPQKIRTLHCKMSQTAINPRPGYFGQLPPAFGLYLRGSGPDKKVHYFYLGTDRSTPVLGFSVFKGLKRKLQAALHSTSEYDSQPLALFGIEGIFRATSILTLPALSETGNAAPRIEKLKDKGGLSNEKFLFTIPVGTGGDQSFEWRLPDALKNTPGVPKVRKLYRVGNDVEVLATWTQELNQQQQMALGYFQFTEAASSAQFGAYWNLFAVASAVRLAQMQWEASAAADQMIKGAGEVITKGLALGMAFA